MKSLFLRIDMRTIQEMKENIYILHQRSVLKMKNNTHAQNAKCTVQWY